MKDFDNWFSANIADVPLVGGADPILRKIAREQWHHEEGMGFVARKNDGSLWQGKSGVLSLLEWTAESYPSLLHSDYFRKRSLMASAEELERMAERLLRKGDGISTEVAMRLMAKAKAHRDSAVLLSKENVP